jgi:hypothetical protein
MLIAWISISGYLLIVSEVFMNNSGWLIWDYNSDILTLPIL